jgi:hypothetical protein
VPLVHILFRLSVRRLLVTANTPSSPILTLIMEALSSSETSVSTRSTRRSIPEDGFLQLYHVSRITFALIVSCYYTELSCLHNFRRTEDLLKDVIYSPFVAETVRKGALWPTKPPHPAPEGPRSQECEPRGVTSRRSEGHGVAVSTATWPDTEPVFTAYGEVRVPVSRDPRSSSDVLFRCGP